MDYHRHLSYLGSKFLPHSLFKVAYDTYQWYSECTYNTTTEKLLELLNDFEKIRTEVESEFSKKPELFHEYKLIAHVIWRSYHQLQAKPLLEAIIAYDLNQAETHFYLAQIYQDQLKLYPQAITHYLKFIELEPNLVPENNYFIDGWFLYNHAYEPSTIEALINLGDIYYNHYQNYGQAKDYYIKAIVLNPHHHLAPYTRLAELLINKEKAFSTALKAYKKAVKNYLKTKWKGYPYDRPCEYYPELEAWAKQKYPFTYRYYEAGINLFVKKLEELAILSFQQDPEVALASIGIAHKIMKQANISPNINLYLKQIEIVLKHYHDYWQAESLCRKVLALEPSNQKAQEYLTLIKIELLQKMQLS